MLRYITLILFVIGCKFNNEKDKKVEVDKKVEENKKSGENNFLTFKESVEIEERSLKVNLINLTL